MPQYRLYYESNDMPIKFDDLMQEAPSLIEAVCLAKGRVEREGAYRLTGVVEIGSEGDSLDKAQNGRS